MKDICRLDCPFKSNYHLVKSNCHLVKSNCHLAKSNCGLAKSNCGLVLVQSGSFPARMASSVHSILIQVLLIRLTRCDLFA